MLKIWMKHKIYEYCIDIIFDNIHKNFKGDAALEYMRTLNELHSLNIDQLKYFEEVNEKGIHNENLSTLNEKMETYKSKKSYVMKKLASLFK